MRDEPDPPRKFYQFKPKDFERLNDAPASPLDAAQSSAPPRSVAPDSPPGNRIDVRDLARVAASGSPRLGVNATQNRQNDVHALLRENLQHENAAGVNELAPKPRRRSRRKRDYWLLLVPVDAFLAVMAFGPHANAVTFVYGIGGIGLYTASLTWVMWGVMDDY